MRILQLARNLNDFATFQPLVARLFPERQQHDYVSDQPNRNIF